MSDYECENKKEFVFKRAEKAEHCINAIQDLFEYRYKGLTDEEIKLKVMSYIDQYSNAMNTKEST